MHFTDCSLRGGCWGLKCFFVVSAWVFFLLTSAMLDTGIMHDAALHGTSPPLLGAALLSHLQEQLPQNTTVFSKDMCPPPSTEASAMLELSRCQMWYLRCSWETEWLAFPKLSQNIRLQPLPKGHPGTMYSPLLFSPSPLSGGSQEWGNQTW